MPYIGNPIYQSAFVTDQFNGDGSTTAFTMSVAPAGVSNVLVAVSGVLQDPSTYGVAGNTITFSTAPPSGTGNISCRYLGVPVTGIVTTAYRTVTEFTATASQTTFTPPSYTVGFINVYLNGVLLGSADYTATNGTTVVLATGASAGNLVTVESFRVETVLNAISNSAGSVSSSNIAGGAITAAKMSSASVDLASSTVTGTLPVANGGTGVTTSTGSGNNVLSTSPTLTTPIVATTIGVGGATPSTSGAGITFPATQSASSNANTLDDYEEGTWTPVFGVPCGFTISLINAANYTKIGNVVTAQCYITLSGTGNSSQIFLDGLPFVAKVGGYWTSSLDMGIGGVLGTYVRVNAGSTECVFLYSGGGTSGSTTVSRQALLANQCGANYIIFSVTYFT